VISVVADGLRFGSKDLFSDLEISSMVCLVERRDMDEVVGLREGVEWSTWMAGIVLECW